MKYYAHVCREESGEITAYQTVAEHLTETAHLCRKFAEAFGSGADGELAGLLHDLGKCTDEFQNRLLHEGPKVTTRQQERSCVHSRDICLPLPVWQTITAGFLILGI